jgi:signal transduction histidine kinase
MTISDDGAGFDPSGATGQGNGLNNMKLRAREIHAQIEIISRSREGTKIELKIPLK